MRNYLLLVVLSVSCNSYVNQDSIVIPVIDDEYYKRSIKSLENQIEEEPDEKYIKLQLSFYEELNWPSNSEEAIKRAIPLLGSDPVFLNQCLSYFKSKEKYEDILTLIKQQEKIGVIPRNLEFYKIEAYLHTPDREMTSYLLADYLKNKPSDDDLLFGARGYLKLGDTILSLFYYTKLYEHTGSTSVIVDEAVPLLVNVNEGKKVIEILVQFNDSLNSSAIRNLALSYYQEGETSLAKNTLLSNMNRENTFILKEWYYKDQLWDSAHYMMDYALKLDSADRLAIFSKGDIDHQRGYFYDAARYFNQLIKVDSSDQEALNQIEILNRKIAYLQRIREAQRDIPTLNLSSKKITDH